MISSLLNHSPVAPRVSHRPSASPQKSNGSGSNAERPALVDDEDDDVVEIERETFSATPKNHHSQPLPPSPHNPMSVYAIAPQDSPLSSIYPATSPVVPQRQNDEIVNLSSSHIGSDDVEMVDNSGEAADLADGLDTDEVVEPEQEPGIGEDGEMDEDDDGEDDDDSDDDEDSEEDDDDDEEGEDDIELIGEVPGTSGQPATTVKEEPADPTIPASDPIAVEGEGEVNTLIPKKKPRKKREASADEDLPAPPPPMKTIRLTLVLAQPGKDLDIEFNIIDEARKAGLEPTWAPIEEPLDVLEEDVKEPLPAGGLLSGMNDDDLTAEEIARRFEERYDKPSKKPTKKKKVKDYYDFADAFIDDSEIAIDDAQTHIPRPKKEGFFVHVGPVELMHQSPEKPARRPAAARKPRHTDEVQNMPSLAEATKGKIKSEQTGGASRSDAIDIDEEPHMHAGPSTPSQRRKSPSPEQAPMPLVPVPVDRVRYYAAARDPKLLPPWPTYPPDVQRALFNLREKSEAHRWEGPKTVFPEYIKPYLKLAVEAAYQNQLWDDDRDHGFLKALCSALPYNSYTLAKLGLRLGHEGYWKFLKMCEDTGLERMAVFVRNEQDKWIAKYEETLASWKSQQNSNGDGASGSKPDTTRAPVSSSSVNADTNNPIVIDDDDEPTPSAGAGQAGKSAEPRKLSVWTQEMKDTFAQLLDNYQDMVDLNKRLAQVNMRDEADLSRDLKIPNRHSDKEHSEANMKSRLYKRVIDLFPEGYTNSNQVSRFSSRSKSNKKQ